MTSSPMREARIDSASVRFNLRAIRSAGPEHEPVVDVSGDAYGHGVRDFVAVARSAGIDAFTVRTESEAREVAAFAPQVAVHVDRNVDDDVSAAAYGVGPLAAIWKLRPAMRISALVMSVKTIDAGEPVSYGYTWRAQRRSTIALVPLGYADGVHRSASNRASALLRGTMRPVVGRIAMDVLTLDLGDDVADLGDEVVLVGDPRVGEPSLDGWASDLGVSPLEVTSNIGARVPRRWTS